MNTIIVGICGGSCSGKTTVLNLVRNELGQRAAYLSFDDYFVKPDLKTVDDWEDPRLYLYHKFIDDLANIKRGNTIRLESNSRESDNEGISSKAVASKSLVFVEGFLIYWDSAASELFDHRYFLDIPESVMIERRKRRANPIYPWDEDDYIKGKLIEGHRKRILPQKKLPGVKVIDGLNTPENISEIILSEVQGSAI